MDFTGGRATSLSRAVALPNNNRAASPKIFVLLHPGLNSLIRDAKCLDYLSFGPAELKDFFSEAGKLRDLSPLVYPVGSRARTSFDLRSNIGSPGG